jgi:hypothetical protein
MMFLFGAFVGAALMGGQTGFLTQQGLSSIPLRCLMVASEAEYRDCRRLSMQHELLVQSTVNPGNAGVCSYVWAGIRLSERAAYVGTKSNCDVDRALTLEIAALKTLNEQLRAQSKTQ